MAKKRLVPMAIAYDFDGTLSPGNMQEHNFIPDLGIKPRSFWEDVQSHAKENDMDEILSYMELMLQKANAKSIKISRTQFRNYGKQIKFYKGVETWFDRITTFAKEHKIHLEHYIISSGLREMIEGTRIKKHFRFIFASGFRYDQHNVAVWPALAVNYTNKTQYLFRINKGVINSYSNKEINKFTPDEDRPIPFSNMIYIGDGETDIPAMKMIKHQGGYAIAVYRKGKKGARASAEELINQERADYALPADFTSGSKLDQVVNQIIQLVKIESHLRRYVPHS